MPKDERPREKLFKSGEHTLSNTELLAILLRSGVRGQSAIDTDLQLTAYALAYRTFEKKKEQSLRFDVMVRNKTPKVQQLTTCRSQDDINRFLKILAYVTKAIKSGIFYANENYFCGICGYKELCKRW